MSNQNTYAIFGYNDEYCKFRKIFLKNNYNIS